jgi:hypothetical protein
MTEEKEARTKWCPFVRNTSGTGSSWNRNHDSDPALGSNCIASACMAWRWAMRQTNEPPHPMLHVSPPWRPEYEPTEHGYCGLAGSPQ